MRSEFDTVRARRCLATFKGGNPHWRRVYTCDEIYAVSLFVLWVPLSFSLHLVPFPHKRHVERILVNEPTAVIDSGLNTMKLDIYSRDV